MIPPMSTAVASANIIGDGVNRDFASSLMNSSSLSSCLLVVMWDPADLSPQPGRPNYVNTFLADGRTAVSCPFAP